MSNYTQDIIQSTEIGFALDYSDAKILAEKEEEEK